MSHEIFGTYAKKCISSWDILILKIIFVYLKFKINCGPMFYLETLLWVQE